MYSLIFSPKSVKDAKKLVSANLKEKCQKLLDIIKQNPYQNPPPYEKLIGDLSGYISRKINIKHRLIYKVLEEKKVVKVLRMWTHYE